MKGQLRRLTRLSSVETVTWIVPCRLRCAAYRLLARWVWKDDRPARMYRAERATLDDFDDDELLYFRWFSDWVTRDEKGSTRLRPAQIPVPNQSVNRSKHGGKCWDVLIPEPASDRDLPRRICQGVVCVPVSGIPEPLDGRFEFRVEHDPDDHNYCHCEVRVFDDDVRVVRAGNKWSVSKGQATAIKKYYRVAMAGASILLWPEVATRGS